MKFRSCLAKWLKGFVELKQACGRSFRPQILTLKSFDAFVATRVDNPRSVDRILLGEYTLSLRRLAPRTRTNRVSVIWPALRYAQRHGAGVPPLPERPSYPRVQLHHPYLYSDQDIDLLLTQALLMHSRDSLRGYTFATLFALLVTAGLRLGEGLRLDLADLELDSSVIHVRQGKFGKSRSLPIRSSTAEGLARYLDRRRRAGMPQGSERAVFLNIKRRRLRDNTVDKVFRRLTEELDLRTPAGKRPRIHDLRHTFAVRQVERWYREGTDVNCRLGALSSYLGHSSVNYTLTYLQANAPLLEKANELFESQFTALASGVEERQ